MIFAPVIRSSAHLNGLRAMDRGLERFLAQAQRQQASTQPLEETEQGYQLQLDVPGLSREHLQVDIEGRVVRIESTAEAARRYRWAFELPQELDAAASTAQLVNGVLTLQLGKKAPPQPQGTRINIT
jgi:HSP20 family protein